LSNESIATVGIAISPDEQLLEVLPVVQHINEPSVGCPWFGRLAAGWLAAVFVGCSPPGAGTIEIADPQAVRAQAGGGGASVKPVTQKQADAIKIEEAAVKKSRKLD
jgi:hypothetical protein